jgi:peroxiredoxin Q/BCP
MHLGPVQNPEKLMSAVFRRPAVLAALFVAVGSAGLQAQEAAPLPGSAAFAPDVGVMAPDFTLPGSTRYGLLKEPVHLADFRGQTVVIAFFPKSRTKG